MWAASLAFGLKHLDDVTFCGWFDRVLLLILQKAHFGASIWRIGQVVSSTPTDASGRGSICLVVLDGWEGTFFVQLVQQLVDCFFCCIVMPHYLKYAPLIHFLFSLARPTTWTFPIAVCPSQSQ